jgi:hypothetical protein
VREPNFWFVRVSLPKDLERRDGRDGARVLTVLHAVLQTQDVESGGDSAKQD